MDQALSERRHDIPTAAETATSVGRKIVVNAGCGYPSRQNLNARFHGPEWREIRIDIDPAVLPDFVCSVTALTPIASESVDAVWSSHNLEHIHRHEVPIALSEFLRILKRRGLLLLTLPNLQATAEFVTQDRLEQEVYRSPAGPITPLDMIFGHTASLARGNRFMAHKTGFTAPALQRLLSDAGFVDLELSRDRFDLWATAYKRAAD